MAGRSIAPLVLVAVLFTCCSAQKSCSGRCGDAYHRGNLCQCDEECLSHNECCRNYESLCTTRDSCKGRCGERFKRGRKCHCDIACVQYNQCCPDYESVCTIEDSNMAEEGDGSELDPQDYTEAEGSDDLNYPQAEDPMMAVSAVVSGNGAPPSNSPEDVRLGPTVVQTPPPLDMPGAEADPSGTSQLAEAEDPDMNQLSVPENVPEGSVSEPEPPSPASKPVHPEPVPTRPAAGLCSTSTPAKLDKATKPTVTPASRQPDQNTRPSSQGTSEASATSASTAPATTAPASTAPASTAPATTAPATTAPATTAPASTAPASTVPASTVPAATVPAASIPTNNADATTSNSTTEPKPSLPEQPKDTLAPEGDPGTQAEPTENTEPTENMDSKAVEVQNEDPTTKTSSTETTTIAQNENIKDLPSPNEDKHEPAGPTGAELHPSDQDQPDEVPSPEDSAQLHREQDPAEPSETTASAGVETESSDPAVKPNTAETTTTSPELSSLKEASTTQPSVKSTTSSVEDSPSPTKATQKPTKPKTDAMEFSDEGSPSDYQADANNDTDLCSGRPVNGLTTLRNGTIVVFRGHYFWTLDSRRNPGPAQGITDVWGIPSPIDTVFTRCNCQGKTYFFKANHYWRFENGVMDPGFPRAVGEGFGLGGHVTAALSVPHYRSRRESVLFFKRGGLAQRYTYRVTPKCGSKLALFTTSKRVRRARDPELGQEMNIRTWRGFPSLVTSAVSVPTTGGDGYKYYVFSPTKYYSLKIEGDVPVILSPKKGTPQRRSAKSWFRCPEIPTT